MTGPILHWVDSADHELIAGVDEVGRGPLCGAVVTAAVILDPSRPIDGLNDSKQLSESRREALFPLIQERALAWAIGRAEVDEYWSTVTVVRFCLCRASRWSKGIPGCQPLPLPRFWPK